jgi:hypothetical protein
MLNTLTRQAGLEKALLAVTLMGTLSLAGCSTDYTTMPGPTGAADLTSNSPSPRKQLERIPIPTGLQVLELCATGAVLCWTGPGHGLNAQIRVDGVLVAECDANDCLFIDNFRKSAGEHHWGITYTRGAQTGPEAIVYMVLPGTAEREDGQRPDWQMEHDN